MHKQKNCECAVAYASLYVQWYTLLCMCCGIHYSLYVSLHELLYKQKVMRTCFAQTQTCTYYPSDKKSGTHMHNANRGCSSTVYVCGDVTYFRSPNRPRHSQEVRAQQHHTVAI